MPFEVGEYYTRAQIQVDFPALEARGAVARNGRQVAVVLLSDNEPGWFNQFFRGPPHRLKMEVNRAHPEHNAALRNPELQKLLFFSEGGGTYRFMDIMNFEHEERDPVLGLFYLFVLLNPEAPVPAI